MSLSENQLPLKRSMNYWFIATQLCYVALLITLTVDHFWVRPILPEFSKIIWGMKILPLLLFMPGLIFGNKPLLIGLNFIILFYFISAVLGLCLPTRSEMHAIMIALTVLLFIAGMMTIRLPLKKT